MNLFRHVRWILLLIPLMLPRSIFAQSSLGAVTDFCTAGAIQATVQGQRSTNTQQGVVPRCTVTVYTAGTVNLATIYANSSAAPLSNPFTASQTGQWVFFGMGCYDVLLSGGVGTNVFATPITLTGKCTAGASSVIGTQQSFFAAIVNPAGGMASAGATGVTTDSATHSQVNAPGQVTSQTLVSAPQIGVQYLAAQFASTQAAVNAAVANPGIVLTSTLGGFTNTSNVPVQILDASHYGYGAILPESYGATGTGHLAGTLHDDGPAINAALAFQSTHFGTCVVAIPNTEYYLATPITVVSKTCIRGTNFVNDGTGNANTFYNGMNGPGMVIQQNTQVQGGTLSHWSMGMNPANPLAVGLYIAPSGSAPLTTPYDLSDFGLEYLSFQNCPAQCVWLHGGGQSTIAAATGIAISSAVRSGNVVTVTTAAAHGLTTGQQVNMVGVTDTSFDGPFTVTSAPTSTTLTFAQTAANATSSGGTVSQTYTALQPIQFGEALHLNMSGASQYHPLPLFQIDGQVAQIKCQGGQINGDGNNSHYPNALIAVTNQTTGYNDAPGDINFDTVAVQNATTAYNFAFGVTFHIHNSYFENVPTPITSNFTNGLYVEDNVFLNSGNDDCGDGVWHRRTGCRNWEHV